MLESKLRIRVFDGSRQELPTSVPVLFTIMDGKPVVRGTRISVELVVDLLAAGWSHAQILTSYPHLTEEDIPPASAASELQREVVFCLIVA